MTNFDIPDFKNDHDAIIAMYVELRGLRGEVQKMAEIIATSPTKEQVTDHETRIRRLELWGFVGLGFLYAIEAYLKFFAK